jgi:predicted Zn-dependent protease
MMRALCRFLLVSAATVGLMAPASTFAASTSGYPDRGKSIESLRPDTDYSDLLQGRPRALGIMQARAQGFVPSPALHDYVRSVLMRDLTGIRLPPSFQPDVRVLAAPEFAALCTPDGTIIVTIGLLEQLENEDELAFVLGHEVSHAIYRHHDSDWFERTQYYAVVNGAAVDDIAKGNSLSFGKFNTANISRGLDAAQHLYKLSSNVLAPQMTRGQEDAADALGFDLMVRAGYDPSAALGVMDVLAEQEAEAARAAAQAKTAADQGSQETSSSPPSSGGLLGGLGGLGSIGGLSIGGISGGGGGGGFGGWWNLGLTVFDKAVDSMATEASSHHPAKEREELLSAYQFREYRTFLPVNPTPLPWGADSRSPLKPVLIPLLSHYSAAEDAAGFVADASSVTPTRAQQAVQTSTAVPTTDHAYTEFVASEYYETRKQPQLSEAALQKAVAGPEPSWEVYSRLADIYVARNDYPDAQQLMTQAVTRFGNSPVLLPKRIEILHGMGRQAEAEQLLPQCDAYDIRELYAECKKAAGKS